MSLSINQKQVGGHNLQSRFFILFVSCLFSILLLGGCTNMNNKVIPAATTYPDKPITLIVPFGVGGANDLLARLLEKSASTHLGQPLAIINKPGGAGTLGWNELSSANPDGYTLGLTGVELLLQPLYGPTKYHYPTALDPLVQISTQSIVMAVQTDQPWQNLNDLITYAKQHPDQIKFGHGGIGTINHLTGETFAKAATINLKQVPFQSGAEVVASLLGNHVQIAFVTPASVKEHVKSGKLKILAIGGDQRSPDPTFSNVPTFKEQGLEVIGNSWYGIAVPKGLPIEIKSKLETGFQKIINDPEFKINLEQLGLQAAYLGSKESEKQWLSDGENLTKMVKGTDLIDLIKSQKK